MQPALVGTLVVLAFPIGALRAQGATSTDLPVRSVVLFSSGVGFFEHGGTVRGSGAAELRFKTTQINDVLKSLTLQDLDGGRVTTITYPSQDPISKTLKSFQVDITSNPGMGELLNQLRGAKVTIQANGATVSGTVLGVEGRVKAMEKGEPIETPTLNVLTGAMIRSIELPAITSLTLDDAKLQDELTRALTALSQARDQDKKPVTISYSGEGARRLRVGYVVETPIWKTSYRLILDEKSARLQGWAIVENQTESDWNGIALSLVSGRPISFFMDLYQPLYLQRPVVVQELLAGLRPQLYGAGTYSDKLPVDRVGNVLGGQPGVLVPRDKVSVKSIEIGANSFEDASVFTDGTSSEFGNARSGVVSVVAGTNAVQSTATTAQLGELFQYSIADVTLARQKSAMLPIVTDSVGIERLSIYNAGVMPRNPLNGVRLRNTTDKHFLQGPVTVIEKGVYAGDARVDNVPPKQERLLSFGVDLDLIVDNTKVTYASTLVSAKVTKGVLRFERKSVSAIDYQVENKGTRDKVVLIEHAARPGWKFVDATRPLETTPTLARFQATAPAGKVTVVPVKEEQILYQSFTIADMPLEGLLYQNRNGEIPGPVRDALSKAAEMMSGIRATDRQIADQARQVTAITQEQARIRENMKTVDAKSQYYGRLLAKLNEQESEIERAQQAQKELAEKRVAQQAELSEYLKGLSVG